jgi:nitrogen fixation/metabolism regulation signal transduction histidine kinase
MAFVMLVGSLINIAVLNYIVSKNLSDYFNQNQIEQIWERLRPAIIISNAFSFITITIFLIILSILITHKLIGPMLKVTGHINKLNSGTLPSNYLKLREGDEGQPLCDAVNELQSQIYSNYDQLVNLKSSTTDKNTAEALEKILDKITIE